MAKKKTTSAFPAELIDTLKQYPALETVYLNDGGEWHFNEHPGFVAFAVADVLGTEKDTTDPKPE